MLSSAQNLASFGGAGGQHACPLARILGINTVIIHKYSSILSAYGMALADTVSEQSMPASEVWGKEGAGERLKLKFDELVKRAREDLEGQGIKESKVEGDDGMKLVFEKYLFMRYNGSDAQLVVKEPEDGGAWSLPTFIHYSSRSRTLMARIGVPCRLWQGVPQNPQERIPIPSSSRHSHRRRSRPWYRSQQ